MTYYLTYFILIPLLGFICSLFIPSRKENRMSRVVVATFAIHFIGGLVFVGWWLASGHPVIDLKRWVLFSSGDYEYYLDFCFDKITATYLVVGSLLTLLVAMYSRYYLHREPGYKRFFNTMLFFYLGYTLIIFSGNLETLFIGWEVLGISSFLLIAFYRERYLPVKNAVKVFSLYRIGDVGLILAMWLLHHLFHQSMTFHHFQNYAMVQEHLVAYPNTSLVISLLILLTAAVKSAQLPFSSWLSRAMEGPTPSSAIFYGSLSVHLGVFLLLRTFPFWHDQLVMRILIMVLGFSTAVICTVIARVQSSVKSQIAYSSSAQIGIIFIEIAAGMEWLALFHFAGNAFLRTYQLLVSPSVVSYLIREKFYTYNPRQRSWEDYLPKKIRYTLYVLSVKEWNLDRFMYTFLWQPIKKAGSLVRLMSVNAILLFSIPVLIGGAVLLFNQQIIPVSLHAYLPELFALIGLLMVLKSFIGRKHVLINWTLIMLNHFWIALAVSFNENFTYVHTVIYLSGITVAGLVGFLSLKYLTSHEKKVDLDKFQGHIHDHPVLGFVFLLASLGLTGFPITPAFIGEDLLFSHIQTGQTGLAFFVSASLIIDGIAAMRIYARVFMGPHIKSVHEMGYRSS